MGSKLLLLVVGFLLTGVLGTVLTSVFQTRTWNHQHEVEQRDEERQQALKTFEEVSARLDKRLYRMRRLHSAARKKARAVDEADIDPAIAAYDDILLEYNDNLNRSLALVETYFGSGVRQDLEDIDERFTMLGRRLDAMVAIVSTSNERIEVPRLDRALGELSGRIYQLNLRMLGLLEKKRLGLQAPPAAPVELSPPVEKPTLRIGEKGQHVRRLQQALKSTGEVAISVDGVFGKETSIAVHTFQSLHDLDADGIVGPKTWAALPEASPTVQMGDEGEQVRRVQQALNRTREAAIDMDGIYGRGTWAAVRSFQRSHNLEADGIVGPETWAALFEEDLHGQ
jgi:peptidoglycan hydrolase-like protein with peptidoglycan-binding domain